MQAMVQQWFFSPCVFVRVCVCVCVCVRSGKVLSEFRFRSSLTRFATTVLDAALNGVKCSIGFVLLCSILLAQKKVVLLRQNPRHEL